MLDQSFDLNTSHKQAEVLRARQSQHGPGYWVQLLPQDGVAFQVLEIAARVSHVSSAGKLSRHPTCDYWAASAREWFSGYTHFGFIYKEGTSAKAATLQMLSFSLHGFRAFAHLHPGTRLNDLVSTRREAITIITG